MYVLLIATQQQQEQRQQQTCASLSCSKPCIVYVLPLLVCPYAMTVALKPSSVCWTIGMPIASKTSAWLPVWPMTASKV